MDLNLNWKHSNPTRLSTKQWYEFKKDDGVDIIDDNEVNDDNIDNYSDTNDDGIIDDDNDDNDIDQ